MSKEIGRTIKVVAENLGIYRGNLSRWKREYEKEAEEAFSGPGKFKPA